MGKKSLLKPVNSFHLSLCHLGDGVESQSLQESPQKSASIVIPEDFESQKEMVRRVINVLPPKLLVKIYLKALLISFASHFVIHHEGSNQVRS